MERADPSRKLCIDTSIADDEDGWGFDKPLMEGSLPMDGYVQKAQERLQNLKIQKQAQKTQHVLKKDQSVDALAEGLGLCTWDVVAGIMADMDVQDLVDTYDVKGVMKVGMDVMLEELVLVYTCVQKVNRSGYVIDVTYSSWKGAFIMPACALAKGKHFVFDHDKSMLSEKMC
ncbi:hypothetical protein GOP47_0017136 [Adiantum capillus-veneris]|uniref:Uncharacterized protein n=1 Tax=Adiantum capillus-veneris TaxID=13818 RepID=A0A9D4UJY6_ADICA|nr:hypothetical protein GOP47_0017136 [Adiantum capillus-veneris]